MLKMVLSPLSHCYDERNCKLEYINITKMAQAPFQKQRIVLITSGVFNAVTQDIVLVHTTMKKWVTNLLFVKYTYLPCEQLGPG